MFEWDFKKLPDDQHDHVLDLFSRGDWESLMLLHNKYKLSNFTYCCSSYYGSIRLWYKHGIDNGHIRREENEDN